MQQEGIRPNPLPRPRPRLSAAALALAVLLTVLFLAVPPHPVLDKADLVGYAICHQIPERSFILNGRPLPLCARCTGTFLGALLGLIAMSLRRRRPSRLPSTPVLLVLIAFIVVWAFDGLNSYLTLFPGAPHLYEPRNWLRLTTGLLNGLALSALVLPIFHFTIWREPGREPAIESLGELGVILPVAGLLALVVQAEIGALLYPLAIVSSLGVLILLVLINALIAAVALRREGYAVTWRQAVVPIIAGAGLSFLEIGALALLRSYLTTAVGISF